MQSEKSTAIYHFLALGIILVWGFTYISTKVLYGYGLLPFGVLALRTLLAYLVIVALAPKKLFAENLYDEVKLAILGFTCVPLCYGLEHMAIYSTQALTAAIMMAVAPLMTGLLALIAFREFRLHWAMILGIVSAATGVALVFFDNQIIFGMSPLGSLFALGGALAWAVYAMIIRTLPNYSGSFIARKAFGYGFLASLPFVFNEGGINTAVLTEPVVIANLLFLAWGAMTLGYIAWNSVIDKLGSDTAGRYLYWVPIVTIVAGMSLLGEKLTFIGMMGTVMILCGVWAGQLGIKRISAAFALGDPERLSSRVGF